MLRVCASVHVFLVPYNPTHVTFVQELLKRQQELEKIATLDQKITLELQSLAEKMETMKVGMPL